MYKDDKCTLRIKLKVASVDIELTQDDAYALWSKLNEIFDKRPIDFPPAQPIPNTSPFIQPITVPANPWYPPQIWYGTINK